MHICWYALIACQELSSVPDQKAKTLAYAFLFGWKFKLIFYIVL